jgi:hypothetical protein
MQRKMLLRQTEEASCEIFFFWCLQKALKALESSTAYSKSGVEAFEEDLFLRFLVFLLLMYQEKGTNTV